MSQVREAAILPTYGFYWTKSEVLSDVISDLIVLGYCIILSLTSV